MEMDRILSELPLQFRESTTMKNRKPARKFNIFKRLSSFLFLTAFLIFLLPYLYITGKENAEHIWLKIILFLLLEMNILLADFVLWNYFKNKRKLILFFIESMLSVLIIYLLI